MTTLTVAWRIRRVAVYASIVPMLLTLAFGIAGSPLHYVVRFVVHRVVSDNGTYFNPDRVEVAVHGGIELALGAMIGGALVEVLLSTRPLRDSWPPLLPRREVIGFGLAMLPFAIAINLLPLHYLHYGLDLMIWSENAASVDTMLFRPAFSVDTMPFRLAFSVASNPLLEWSLAGLIAAPLAGRMLSLPAWGGGVPGGWAIIRLVCTLLATSLATSLLLNLAFTVLVTEMHATNLAAPPYPMRLAMLYLAKSAYYLIWYFAALTFITIAAATVAIMMRRISGRTPRFDGSPSAAP
jgi:hypothetical protein